jgi:hypothetical protein
MESMVAWCAERGLRLEPFGVDLSARLERMVRHQLEHLVASGGRLLASSYVPVWDRSRHADQTLARLGFRVDGVTRPAQVPGGAVPPTAWILRHEDPPAQALSR